MWQSADKNSPAWSAENPEPPKLENLDNYLAEIARAKTELKSINDDIAWALEQKARLVAGNEEILQEKLEEIEQQRKDAEAALFSAQALEARNKEDSQKIKDTLEAVSEKEELLMGKKAEHLSAIQSSQKDIDLQFLDLHRSYEDLANQKKALDNIRAEQSAQLESILAEKEANQKIFDQTQAEKAEVEGKLAQANENSEQANRLYAEATELKKQASAESEVSKAAFEEASKINSEAKLALEKIAEEKERLKDMIIESKKAKFEASVVLEQAQKQSAEANHKLAELKALREAMTQQEN